MARRRDDAIAVLLAAACSPSVGIGDAIPDDFVDRYAVARCGAVTRCACDPSGFADEAMCVSSMREDFEVVVDAMRDADVAFDAACFDQLIAFWDSADACDAEAAVPYCGIAHGDDELGQGCDSLSTHGFSASSCAPGSVCTGNGCQEPQPPPVELALFESCGETPSACTDGTYCDGQEGICSMQVGAGNSCPEARACDDASWCDFVGPIGQSTCEPRALEGEACGSTSAWDARACVPVDGESRYCVDGTCTFAVAAACGPWL